MWWRLITALAMVAALLAAGLFTLGYAGRACGQIDACLATAMEAVTAAGSDGTAGLEQAFNLWQRGLPFFCSYVIHDQVDVVSETFQRALGLLESQTWDEYLATLRELRFQVALVRDYDRPNIRSVF